MTDLKYSVLEHLYNSEYRKLNYVDLINLYKNPCRINEVAQALKDFKEDGLVKYDISSTIELLKLGRTIYESVKEEREYQAECERREQESKRREQESKRLAKISNILALASTIATVLSVIVALLQLFHK